MADEFESVLRIAAALSGLGAVTVAFLLMWRRQTHPSTREYGKGAGLLTRRSYIIALTLGFIVVMFLLWEPVPISISSPIRLTLDIVGAVIFFPAVALYLIGMQTLGPMFGPSSGFGARLYTGHRLITSGPYRVVRHPMYLGVICAGIGGLCIYRTWGMLFFAVMMFGLIVRARVEEQVLALEFGNEWEEYKRKVPGWIPRIGK